MLLKVLNIATVVASDLCCGCGACAYISPGEFEMIDVPSRGRRPRSRRTGLENDNRDRAAQVCPGSQLDPTYDPAIKEAVRELAADWGPVLKVWEGYAADPDIQFAGSSGGAGSALGLFAIERCGMHGVLHIASRPDAPHLNQTVLSKTRDQLLGNTGSRYAPASPCEGLQLIEDATSPCVFIGKPCDVAGAKMAARIRPALAKNLGVTIAIFCAGTPTTRGTLEMLKRMGIEEPSTLVSLRYRGNGWPGKATAVCRTQDGLQETRQLNYEESWGEVLSKHVQWRCRLCADHTGEFADIAVGDPWHKPPQHDEPGRSLIVARTERGKHIIENAISNGYLVAEEVNPRNIEMSQPNLLKARASVWGRIFTCRILGVNSPRYRGMPLFRNWLRRLNFKEKVQSIVGTIPRIYRRGLYQ